MVITYFFFEVKPYFISNFFSGEGGGGAARVSEISNDCKRVVTSVNIILLFHSFTFPGVYATYSSKVLPSGVHSFHSMT